MTTSRKHTLSIDVDPLSATTALGVAQLCMLRFFEEMNLQPKDKRLFDARTQKKMMHVLASIYNECMDATGIRRIIDREGVPVNIGAVASDFSNYMGVSYDYPEPMEEAV